MKTLMGELMNNISSYDTNIMLAAIISLLLVILFVLLLHIYAKWFLTLSRHSRAISPSSVTISYALRPHPFHSSPPISNGLHPSLISSIPLFVHSQEDEKGGLECAVCLSVFEASEIGRRLAKCGHCFHVECIDMWLRSHLTCPVCRAPAAEDEVESSREIVVIDVENIGGGSVSPSSSSSDLTVGCCSDNLKRVVMLSRNRSDGCKVFPSVVVDDE